MNEKQTILVTGATGLVGQALCAALQQRGHMVRTLSRSESGDFRWDVDAGELSLAALEGVDAVVHLAGESVAQRWSEAAKARIMDSRVGSTKLLVDHILALESKPAFICASGTNYYGYDLDEVVDESAPSGAGFLAEVCRAWEGAAQPLSDGSVRTVFMRTGIVLSTKGGALAKMLTPFKLGLGGRIGDGKQLMSCVGLPDLVAMYVRAVEDDSIEGGVNAVAPEPVTNRVFTKALGKVLGRPTIFPLPEKVVQAIFGDMADETLLADVGVLPKQLQMHDFVWQAPKLEQIMSEALEA